jgi:hypothetical protein
MLPLANMSVPSLRKLGEEMRAVADKYPDDDKPQYSNNETEVIERIKTPEQQRDAKWLWEVGLSRAIQYEGDAIITLCITREDFENPPQYRLSMCRVRPGSGQFAFVPPLDAALIAASVLGEGAKIVHNPSGIENAKHFVKVIGYKG